MFFFGFDHETTPMDTQDDWMRGLTISTIFTVLERLKEREKINNARG